MNIDRELLPNVVLATRANVVQSVRRNGGSYAAAGKVLGVTASRAREISMKYDRLMRVAVEAMKERVAEGSDSIAVLGLLARDGWFVMPEVDDGRHPA